MVEVPFEDFRIEVSPMVDFVVKLMLGNQERSHITCHFLNSLLRWENPITSVMIQNPFIEKDFDDDKLCILDVLATDSANHNFNIEIQRLLQTWLGKRLTYYGASLLVEQILEGDNYRSLRPVISICLLNAKFFRDSPDRSRPGYRRNYHREFRLRTAEGDELSNLLQIHLLELPRYEPTSDTKEIADPLEQWLYFFRYAEGRMSLELLRRLPDPIFRELVEILKMIQRTPEQRRLYEMRIRAERDYKTGLEEARLYGIELGREEGKALGKAEGREEGRQEGRQEGKAEGVALGKIRTLQQLLNLPEITDSEFSNLTPRMVETLTDDLRNKIRNRP